MSDMYEYIYNTASEMMVSLNIPHNPNLQTKIEDYIAQIILDGAHDRELQNSAHNYKINKALLIFGVK